MSSWQIQEMQRADFKILAVNSMPDRYRTYLYGSRRNRESSKSCRTVVIKIETRGSGGAKNVLTDQEIADADCIIVAADTQVPMDRFDGKTVIELSGIRRNQQSR